MLKIPILAIVLNSRTCKGIENYTQVSDKFYITIPFSLLSAYQNKRILIIDDVYLSGQTIEIVKKELIKEGYLKENIFTAGLVVNSNLIVTEKYPNYAVLNVRTEKYNFSWRTANDG